jgi:uncharacterized protein (DUF885 family)
LTHENAAATPAYQFAERAWDDFLALNPMWATAQGDERWDDQLGDPGPAGRAAELALSQEWDAEMARLDGPGLSVEDSVTLGLIRVVVRRTRESHALRLWEMEGIDQHGGPQGLIGDLARLQRTDTPERISRLLSRLHAYPAWLEAHANNLQSGIASGRTAARAVLDRCITQTRRIVDTPAGRSPLLLANPDLTEGDRDAITTILEREVLPAQRRWLTMLERYADHARTGDGICHLPDGDDLYRHHILAWTTIEEDPRAIHAYGLERLDEIEAEARTIATQLGHDDIGELRRFLSSHHGGERPRQSAIRSRYAGLRRLLRARWAPGFRTICCLVV